MSSKGSGEKVFVTGGAGFIGSHVVDYHLAKGDEVWAIDALYGDVSAPTHLSPNLRFDHAEVTTFPHLKEALMWADKVYHLAATLGMYRVISDPVMTLSNNFQSTDKLLKVADEVKSRAHIMLASSSGVYAHTPLINEEGYKEGDLLAFPSGQYRQESYYLSKMVSEIMGLSYAKDKGIFCVSIRYFNVVGPRQSGQYGMVVPRFVKQALEGKPLSIFGDGSQTRCFMNVKDAVKAVDLLLSCEAANGEIVNVGNKEEVSILELANRVIEKTGSSSKIEFISYEKAYGHDYEDVQRRVPCGDKLHGLTGFTPSITLDQTIDEIITSFSPAHLPHSWQ